VEQDSSKVAPIEFGVVGHTRVQVLMGDLWDEGTNSAIVCPVNTWLYLNGGVARQLATRLGDGLESELQSYSPLSIGKAVMILPIGTKRPIIFAPTVRLPVDSADGEAVSNATMASLRCADQHGIDRLRIPALGAGTGGVPYDECAIRIIGGIRDYFGAVDSNILLITLVSQSPRFLSALRRAFEQSNHPPSSPDVAGGRDSA
jgi:O-acetyl-ADP-ribose deacetylase (regulator of RNase III)